MITPTLAGLRSTQGLLVSVYLNHPPGPSSALLSDLLKPLRARADELGRPAAKALRSTCDRIHDLSARIDADPAPAVAVFASEDVFEYLPLQQRVWDHASVGPHPYLRPLRALPRPLHAAVLVAERRRAFLYELHDDDIAPLAETLTADVGKANYGGFQGYEEHRVRGHAGEETARMLREATERLLARHQEEPFEMLAVGGHQEALDELTAHLHPYLQAVPMERFVIDPHTMTPPIIRERVKGLVDRIRADEEQRLVERTLAAVESETGAATGTAAVLTAANARAVDLLVVSGRFDKSGVVCDGCGWLGRSAELCPVCGRTVFRVDDVVGEAMEAVVAAGGTATQVSLASPLDRFGVASILRFPI